ncbi:MAG: alpha-glucan family phosphorylase [Rhodocyclaceae bacterium]|nr:alpha-glucan family phosphorylase [Rhodocyclaceae bacterium]
MAGTRYELEVNPKLPPRLARLDELANNLLYSWDSNTQALFARLGSRPWLLAGHSPKAFLNRIDQGKLNQAAEDPEFLEALDRVLATYDAYLSAPRRADVPQMDEGELIAYFCAEFGFHESLPIYSGGLGILAGDHCKSASDMGLPFIGVGLLYRQGYFQQTIDGVGRQAALYHDSDFDDLPIAPIYRKNGEELHIQVDLPGRTVEVKVWRTHIGRVTLYLLDTDIERNATHDRDITHRLYGGDRNTRIEQEIILGVGGVRALQEIGLTPTVWHINEGHAAFLIVERMRRLLAAGLGFPAAIEAVAVNTVFTTHTAVPAGHDHFSEEMIRRYFTRFAEDTGSSIDALLGLGREHGKNEFNMTSLAIHGSRHHNGVSRVHGQVSASICTSLWPQIEPEENPIDYITNGVHVPSFLSELWHDPFDHFLGPGWSQHLTEGDTWKGVQAIPDHVFWSIRQSIKSQMLHLIRYRLREQHARNYGSQAHLDRLLKLADPDNPNVLTIGFARRFATYKRATLLFQNLDWLRRIVSDAERPILFIFAGKAHPADEPGQSLIQRIAEVAEMPEFEGRILLIEGYDLHLGRRLVSGVDVWLNNPLYPMEASGTSGMKAALNGVINLSVLDGWWDEGFEPGNNRTANGWAIKPVSVAYDESRRNNEEARTLYELLQDKILPLYYERGAMGYSPGWVAMAKRSIATIAPRFNSTRMVGEYVTKFYRPAAQQWHRYSAGDFAPARQVAAWKERVRSGWDGVALHMDAVARRRIAFGEALCFDLTARLNGLNPEDVRVELLLSSATPEDEKPRRFALAYQGQNERGEARYRLELTPELCGKLEYRIRAYPCHELLSHPFEMGMMVWL